MKLLNLIIYSTNIPEYEEMYKIQTEYLKKNCIEHYFIIFSKNINEMFGENSDIVIYDNIIYIKGSETFIPGILRKTISAIEIFKDRTDFDYIVRSNISEIVNFDLLNRKLSEFNLDYGGAKYKKLTWLDPRAGIFDWSYYNRKFIQGNAIIISNNFKNIIIENKKKINFNIIDDVAFGLFYEDLKHKYNLKDVITFEERINANSYEEDVVFYRNKHEDRKTDVINMKKICDEILKMKKN
jgi:hypothetical protein